MPRLSAETRQALRKWAHDELRWDVVALCADLDKADSIIAAKDAKIAVLRGVLEEIHEYWNRDENEDAMKSALWFIMAMSEGALATVTNDDGVVEHMTRQMQEDYGNEP